MLGPPHKSGYSDTRGAASRPPIVTEGGLENVYNVLRLFGAFWASQNEIQIIYFYLSEYEDIPLGIKVWDIQAF